MRALTRTERTGTHRTMTLSDWLRQHGKSPDWLSAQLTAATSRAVSASTVRRWLSGDRTPRHVAHIREIERLTGGHVSASDVLHAPRVVRPPGRPRCRRMIATS